MKKIKVLRKLLEEAIREAYADDEVTAEVIKNEILDFTSSVLKNVYEEDLCIEDILAFLKKKLSPEEDYIEELVHILDVLNSINSIVSPSDSMMECFKAAVEDRKDISILRIISDYAFVVRVGNVSVKVIGMLNVFGEPVFGRLGKVSCYNESGYVRDLTVEEIKEAYQRW